MPFLAWLAQNPGRQHSTGACAQLSFGTFFLRSRKPCDILLKFFAVAATHNASRPQLRKRWTDARRYIPVSEASRAYMLVN
jgi:hypothetical protein